MRTRRTFLGVTAAISAVCFVSTLAGCSAATGYRYPAFETIENQDVTLSVVNRNFEDVRVYMLRGGSYLPLGRVDGMQTRKFRISKLKLGYTRVLRLAMVATPSHREIRMFPVDIEPGQLVEARLGTTLNNSSVFVH